MTLYLSSSWAEEEMKSLQEDKNKGKVRWEGWGERRSRKESENSEKMWKKHMDHNKCEGSGAEEEFGGEWERDRQEQWRKRHHVSFDDLENLKTREEEKQCVVKIGSHV